MANGLARCQRNALRQITDRFAQAHQEHFGKRPPRGGHPSAAAVLLRLSGGRLPQVFSRCERVASEAAAQGFSSIDLGVVVCRWGS